MSDHNTSTPTQLDLTSQNKKSIWIIIVAILIGIGILSTGIAIGMNQMALNSKDYKAKQLAANGSISSLAQNSSETPNQNPLNPIFTPKLEGS